MVDYYNYDEVVAIIPARAGSKGVKDKNIRQLFGFPLLAYSIAAAKLVPEINRIIVSTDSKEYAKIAIKYGAEIPGLRPKEISGSDSLDIEYLKYTLNMIRILGEGVPEYVALLRPTTPIRDPLKIQQAVNYMKENESITAVVSVHNIEECPFKWVIQQDNGYLQSPFENLSTDDVNLPRQNFPKVLEPDGYIDILKSKIILEKNKVYADRAVPFYINENVVDIDVEKDFSKIESKEIKDNILYQYLYEHYVKTCKE